MGLERPGKQDLNSETALSSVVEICVGGSEELFTTTADGAAVLLVVVLADDSDDDDATSLLLEDKTAALACSRSLKEPSIKRRHLFSFSSTSTSTSNSSAILTTRKRAYLLKIKTRIFYKFMKYIIMTTLE